MDRIEKIKREGGQLKREFQKKIAGYIMAAFGLVAGLAWNETVKTFIEYLFPMSQSGLWAKFIYASLLTLILVLITLYVSRFFTEEEKE